MPDHLRHGLDAMAAGTALATFLGWLPSIASLLSIVWLLIQIGTWTRKTFFPGEE